MALLAPVTANTLSPTASSTSTGPASRLRRREKANATRAPAAATAKYRQSRNVAGGRSSNSMSRMMPPPSAVIIPSVITPTMSSRATRTAVNAPLRPNANVPVRSRTSSKGDSLLMCGPQRRWCTRPIGFAPSSSRPAALSRGAMPQRHGRLSVVVLLAHHPIVAVSSGRTQRITPRGRSRRPFWPVMKSARATAMGLPRKLWGRA